MTTTLPSSLALERHLGPCIHNLEGNRKNLSASNITV
jgi:hypothetical protein